MSATEVLRRMLDERGVEWQAYELNPFEKTTSWDIDTSDPVHEVCASLEEFDNGTTLLRFWNCTPAQAIAATLGAGTCKRVMDSIDPFTMWVCDQCWHPLDTSENFCGGCGRKVVDDG